VLILVGIFGAASFSQQEKGTMHQKDTMGRMDKTMDQSNHIMKNMDMMMGKRMDHGCMGMMNMKGMGMMMHNMSQNMVDMMERMESMMDNPEMTKDKRMKEPMDWMHEHMMKMSQNMQKAMGEMEMMQKSLEEMETK
jgi:hypothetical protein